MHFRNNELHSKIAKKTKFIKYPLVESFAPQQQQNLAAIVADLEAGISKFVSHT